MKDRVGSMTVIVAGQPVQEYEGEGKTYIEMDLQASTSYDCEYKDDTPHGEEVSKWPVTPYTVQAQNHATSHYWCELHLDGAFVKQELLTGPDQDVHRLLRQRVDARVPLRAAALPAHHRRRRGGVRAAA